MMTSRQADAQIDAVESKLDSLMKTFAAALDLDTDGARPLQDIQNEALKILNNSDNSKESYILVGETARLIAEASKKEQFRKDFDAKRVVECLVDALSKVPDQTHETESASIQICRAIANLCINHDANRKTIIDCDGHDILLKLLNGISNPTAVRAVFGTLINMCIDCAPAQAKITNSGISQIIETSKRFVNQEDVAMFTAKLLSSLQEQEKFVENMINVDGISYVTTRFKILEREQELGDCDQILNLVEVLEKLSSNSESIQLQLFSKDFLSSLLDVLDYYSTSAHVLIDESDSDEKETFISILDHLARVITNVTLPDENVSRLINDTAFLERLISWLDRQCTSEDPEVMTATVDTQKMVAGLCIGNLGSNDASATKLIHDVKIHEKLLSVLKTTNNLRVQHAVVSSLRNLALSPNNKIVLAETSLVELCLPLLSTFAQPIHLAIISIIRMLAPSSAQVSCDLVMKKFSSPNGMEQSAIEALMSHFEKSNDQPTICEIGKTITAFVKLLWGTFSADLDPAVDTAKILLMEITRLEPIYRLITSQYLVLQNEGVLALAIILKSAQAGGRLREIIQTYPPKIEIINSLISILSNSKVQVTQVKSNDEEEFNQAGAKAYPVEMRLNVAQLFLSSRVVFPDEMSKLGPTLAQTYQHLQEEPMTGNEKLQQLKELTNMLCGNESIEK